MVQFAEPFVGNIPKKISPTELVQALRVDLAGELEAIVGYEVHAASTDDPRAKQILYAIRDEELQHVGMLQNLIEMLDPHSAQFHQKGETRFQQTINQQPAGQQFEMPYQPMR